jgi:hypothetical protein
MGVGHFSWLSLLYSLVCMFILLFIGIIFFNRVEKFGLQPIQVATGFIQPEINSLPG